MNSADEPGPENAEKPEGFGFPSDGSPLPGAPQAFEPLDSLEGEDVQEPEEAPAAELAEKSEASAEPTVESRGMIPTVSTPNAEKSEDHDADGMAMRGDEGGPDFLASEDMDDWEKELMVDDDDNEVFSKSAAEVAAEKAGTQSEETLAPAGAGSFPWISRVQDESGTDSAADLDAEPIESMAAVFSGMAREEESQSEEGFTPPWMNQKEEPESSSSTPGENPPGAKPLDFETFSERLKSAPLWKAPSNQPAPVPADEQSAPESPVSESVPATDAAPEPPQSEEDDIFSTEGLLVEDDEEPSSPSASQPVAEVEAPIAKEPEAAPEHQPEPVAEVVPAPVAETSEESSEVIAEAAVEPSTPMEEPVAKTEAAEESAMAIAPKSEEIIDVACPDCGKGLSLRREHLGIAGHCVWCSSPLVAAASAMDGVVRVFLLKSDAEPTAENAPKSEEPEEESVPLPASPLTASELSKPLVAEEPAAPEAEKQPEPAAPEPVVSPWSNAPATSEESEKEAVEAEAPEAEAKAEVEPSQITETVEAEKSVPEGIEGETVEPEVLGSVEENETETTPAPSADASAWQMPATSDSSAAASMWAERAAAVQQTLSGAAASAPTNSLTASNDAAETTSTEAPTSAEDGPKSAPQAFSWMDPKPGHERLGADSEKAETESKAEPVAESAVEKSESESSEGASAFSWAPPSGGETPSPSEKEAEAKPETEAPKDEASAEPEIPTIEPETPSAEAEKQQAKELPDPNQSSSPFNWKAPAGDSEEGAKSESSETPADKPEEARSNDPFASINAALAKAEAAEKREEPAESKSAADASAPFQNLSSFLNSPDASFEAPKSAFGDSTAAADEKPMEEKSSGKASLWPSSSDEKASDDPFAAGLLVDEPAEAGETEAKKDDAAEGTRAESDEAPKSEAGEESAAKPEASGPGASLFSAGMADLSPADKKSEDTAAAESSEASEPESKADAVTTESELEPEKEEPTEDKKAAKNKKSEKKNQKSGKEKAAERKAKAEAKRAEKRKAKASEGKPKKVSVILKVLTLGLVLVGLLAGAAGAYLMKDKLFEAVPQLKPLLEKVLPAKSVEESMGSSVFEEAPAGEAMAATDAAELAADSTTDLPLPETTTTAQDTTTTSLNTAETPSVTTGSDRAPVKPAVVPVPEKKSLFGGGPLLINDGGAQETEPSE